MDERLKEEIALAIAQDQFRDEHLLVQEKFRRSGAQSAVANPVTRLQI